jgi:hypothetical protein
MKRYILFIIFLLSSLVSVAKTQVALVTGDQDSEKIADLILANLNDSDFVFLERNQVQQILREQNLTAMKLTSSNTCKLKNLDSVDLFALIRKEEKTPNRLLIIFDMDSGIRLAYQRLPDDIPAATEKVKNCLTKATLVKKIPKVFPTVVIANINNAGTPPQFSEQLKDFTREFELSLSNIPNILVLERNSLDHINLERHITRRFYPLLVSSYYLRLEFTPGSEFNIINVSVNITDASKKPLYQFHTENLLVNPSKSIDSLLTCLSKFLETNKNVKNNHRDEAKQLYKDFKRNGYRERSKIEAAIALDSGNLIYKEALLRYFDMRHKTKTIQKKIDYLISFCNMYKDLKKGFPKHYSQMPMIPHQLLRDLYGNRKKMTSVQIGEVKNLLPEIKAEYIKLSKIKCKNNFSTYWSPEPYIPLSHLYFNDKLYINDKYQYWIKAVNASRNDSRQWPKYYPRYIRLSEKIMSSYRQLLLLQKNNDIEARKQLYSELKKFVKAAENHPIEQINTVANNFKLLIDLHNSPSTRTKEIIKDYLYKSKKKSPNSKMLWNFQLLPTKEASRCRRIFQEINKEYQINSM